MFSQTNIYSQLLTFATTTSALILNPETPQVLRRLLIDLTKDLKRELPDGVMAEIAAAEAEAVIRAVNHLRRTVPDS